MNEFRQLLNYFVLYFLFAGCLILMFGYIYIHLENKHYQISHKNQMNTLREVRQFYDEMQADTEEDCYDF